MKVYVLIMNMGGDDPHQYIEEVTSSREKAEAWVASNELFSKYYEEFDVTT